MALIPSSPPCLCPSRRGRRRPALRPLLHALHRHKIKLNTASFFSPPTFLPSFLTMARRRPGEPTAWNPYVATNQYGRQLIPPPFLPSFLPSWSMLLGGNLYIHKDENQSSQVTFLPSSQRSHLFRDWISALPSPTPSPKPQVQVARAPRTRMLDSF
jgi:hypothetical protein